MPLGTVVLFLQSALVTLGGLDSLFVSIGFDHTIQVLAVGER